MKHTMQELQKMSVNELKAFAYDLFALAEQTQNNIKIINGLIAQKSEQTLSMPPEVKEDKKI